MQFGIFYTTMVNQCCKENSILTGFECSDRIQIGPFVKIRTGSDLFRHTNPKKYCCTPDQAERENLLIKEELELGDIYIDILYPSKISIIE